MDKKYHLVIVESPSKAKTIEKYLGSDYKVIASKGHIMDLPKKKLGVNLTDFSTEIVPIDGKESTIKEIIKLAKDADKIFLASDPDREGESIAFHLQQIIKRKDAKRVLFNAITKPAIIEAINNPLELDQQKYEAQQTRRILDRIIGYKISPILWEKMQKGLSAGRVQSVTLKIIVLREEEIKNFIPEKWFDVLADFHHDSISFKAKYTGLTKESNSIKLKDKDIVDKILIDIKDKKFKLIDSIKKEKSFTTSPPYTTSKLQQEASSKLGFGAKQTMQVAQKLYEGIEISSVGRTGLITYMRTDSVRTESVALDQLREFIKNTYGNQYLNKDIILHKQKKTDSKVQDAHEAIRPTNLTLDPDKIRGDLTTEEYQLYKLIWNKFISSQMSNSLSEQTTNIFLADDKYFFQSKGSVIIFDGYKKVFNDTKTDSDDENSLPIIKLEDELLPTKQPYSIEKSSTPPPRFNEGTLVKELEDKGIGRPSTYATIISNLIDRTYVSKGKDSRFVPTELGINLCKLLEQYFPVQMDISFTSKTEDSLDEIEEGSKQYKELLKVFWESLSKEIQKIQDELPTVNSHKLSKEEFLLKLKEASKTDIKCEKCEGFYVIKKGSNGDFLACSNYPDCKSTKNFEKDKSGKIKIIDKNAKKYSDELCKLCGKRMVIIEGKNGKFLSCEDYPNCKSTQPLPSKAHCSKCETGKLVERKTKTGKYFYGCNQYPKCDLVIWDDVIFKKCKHCSNEFLIKDPKTKNKICFKCRKEN